MKINTLSVLAGVSVPLILTGPTDAGFVGISWTTKPNNFGLWVQNVYAEFDAPGDAMQSVAGTPNAPLSFTVVGGTFWNHPTIGGDLAPNSALFGLFPSLEFDTFVTIGVKATGPLGQPADNTTLVNFPQPIAGTSISTTNGSYALLGPEPQGNPFDPINCFPGDGRVLLGQFTTANGFWTIGSMVLKYVADGVVTLSYESFGASPAPGALWLLALAGLAPRRRRR